MISIHCRTNLDLFGEQWPTELPSVPCMGQRICSKTRHQSFRLRLEVICVTWEYSEHREIWLPHIDLHDYHKGWSIADFYEWYAPLVGKGVSAFI